MAFILLHEKTMSAEARDRRVFVNTRRIVSIEPRSRGCRVSLAGLDRSVYTVESDEDVLSLIRFAEEDENE